MVKLFVEGGGNAKRKCRKGFTTFITKAGIKRRPHVVPCGSRQNAFESYRTAIGNKEKAILLVDSETAIDETHQRGPKDTWKPWEHLKHTSDSATWSKPATAKDTDCHFMTQIMESWFIADRNTLEKFFGAGFKTDKLPSATTSIESIEKDRIYSSLKEATTSCTPKGEYNKGSHSFEILAEIDPRTVMDASPWAKRFIDALKEKMDA